MKRAFLPSLVVSALCGQCAYASPQPSLLQVRGASEPGKIERSIGNWYVSIETDPFTDKKKTIALTKSGRGILVIRCFPDEGLTALIFTDSNKEYAKDSTVDFKYRADRGQVVQDSGRSFGEKGAMLPNARQIFQDAGKSASLYFRIDTPDGTMTDYVFHPQGATRALTQIGTDCPEPSPASPGKDNGDSGDKPSKS